ncbi:MAG: hypothetical protein LBS89_05675, partial [Zoogloeaceae bacterium]|nr:hypothetical protein [Zoogloeaceae bacterium]
LALIRRHVNLLSLLIQEDALRDQTARARSLLVPLDNPKARFMEVLWRERVFMLQYMGNADLDELSTEFDPETPKIISGGRKILYFFLFKRQMTQNLGNEIMAHTGEIIDEIPISRLSSEAESIYSQAVARAGCTISLLTCRKSGLFFWKNYIGEGSALFLATDSADAPNYANYLLRMHDLDARIRLVRAQLEYKLAAKKPGDTPEKILPTLGPETFNPYTDQPFEWNAEQSSIGFTPGAAGDKKSRLEIRLSPARG